MRMSLLFSAKTVVDSPARRRIHLLYCLITPCTYVHVKAPKTPLTQTMTQMRIGAESTGEFCPAVNVIYSAYTVRSFRQEQGSSSNMLCFYLKGVNCKCKLDTCTVEIS